MVGLWVTGHPAKREAAIELHRRLSDAIRAQEGSWSMSHSDLQRTSHTPWPIATYQSILLQIIMAALLAKERASADLSLRVQLDADDYYLLTTLVRSCRELGMFCYPNMVEQHSPAAPLAMIWVNVEEIKRFGFSLYKLCRVTSLVGSTESNAGMRTELLTVADLEYCMPDSDQFWDAPAVIDENERQQMISQSNRREGMDPHGWVSYAARVLCDAQVKFEWI
ncbi:hypothetical protein ABOM_001474 [Aspergillus bombycis]|uniref:Uncharacterized protein n=1 Tax=Aspergillus bombycis TaxID=109264 RepID=A0A1F8ADS0_9EURO|nr:hypothetical protein ABOM_001474 [Aspergillus bombycis]OGM49860.1 hypothetical protein ABOM_001474 [Aspergillus bombycis]